MPGLEDLVEDAVRHLRGLGGFVEVGGGSLLVVGDTHGYPEATSWALSLAERLGAERIVFLGDYVDRGPRGVENLELVLENMLAEPERFLLLRGNHEDPTMNLYYGFASEASAKLRGGLDVVEELYACLPLHAVAPKGVWLVHGGVPCTGTGCGMGGGRPPSFKQLVEEAGRLHCRARSLEPPGIGAQLVWNDPRGGAEWFEPSPRGPGIYVYGRRAWLQLLSSAGLSFIVRAHETVDAVSVWRRDGGYEPGLGHGERRSFEELRGSVVTVFTSLYHGLGAGALYLVPDEEVAVAYRYPGRP